MTLLPAPRSRRPPREVPVETLHAAAVAAAVAGAVHLWVVPDHLAGSLLAGGFFLLVGCAQIVLAAVLVVESPGPRALGAVALAHVALVGLYVASRTSDLPLAPVHARGGHVDAAEAAAAAPGGVGNGVPIYPGSRTESVGVIDVVAVVAELVLVALLLGRVTPHGRAVVLDVAVALGVGLVLLRVLG